MEDTNTYLTRKDAAFLRAPYRPENNFKRSSGLDVDESVAALIRMLATSHSQAAIAAILNEKGILRNGDQLWQQFHISRYCKANGIKAVHAWRGALDRQSYERQDV
jgi:hypothetical protein